jgi:hypothetical protein
MATELEAAHLDLISVPMRTTRLLVATRQIWQGQLCSLLSHDYVHLVNTWSDVACRMVRLARIEHLELQFTVHITHSC